MPDSFRSRTAPLQAPHPGPVLPMLLVSALILAAVGGPAHGQEGPILVLACDFESAPPQRPSVMIPPLVKPPQVDGRLDDLAWAECMPAELGSDMPGGEVSRPTWVRLCRDEKTIYVAFDCREPAIGEMPVAPTTQDALADDNVQVFLKPGPEADMYVFGVDPNGSKYDWSLLRGKKWTADWRAAVARTAEGWTAEMAIPLASLGVEEVAGHLWSLNFGRDISLTGEQASWQPTLGHRRNRSRWGAAFFGSIDEYENRSLPAQIRIYAERWILGAADRTLQTVVRIDPGDNAISDLRLQVTLAQTEAEGPAVLAQEAIPAEGERASLILNAEAFPPGRSELSVALLDQADEEVARGSIVLQRQAATRPEPPTGRIRILVPGLSVSSRAAGRWPITTGVAFPRGVLYSPDHVRLTGPDGREVPCQAQVRERWPGDDSIRWLGLDFQADITGPDTRAYILEYGPRVRRMPVSGFIRKMRTLPFDVVHDTWVINTGRLLFTVNYRHFAGIEEAWVDVDGNRHYDWHEQILNATRTWSGPYMIHANGQTYTLDADPQPRVRLEEWNELRLVLRGEGRLLSADGEPGELPELGRCIVRITAYAEQPFVQVQYTIILTRTAEETLLRDFGVAEKLDFGRWYDAVFGTPQRVRHSMRKSGPVYLLRPSADRAIVREAGDDPSLNLEETEAEDWVCAAARNRGVAVCLRDMAHLYPKELELRPDGRLRMHFWPAHMPEKLRAEPEAVDRRTVGGLGFAHQGALFDLRVPPAYSYGLQDRDGLFDFDAVRYGHLSEITGMGLTYDLLYLFYGGDLDEEEISQTARAFELRPHALQDRESLAASGVLPEMLSAGRAKRAADLAVKLLELEGRNSQEGDLNFLDLHRRWLPQEKRWALRRHWVGNLADVPAMLWVLYLQTGRPELFRAAARSLRHLLSVDVCHFAQPGQTTQADPRRRKIPGGFGDHRTPFHWQSTCHLSDRYARIRPLLLAHYLTGEALPLDVVRLWAQAVRTYGVPTTGEDGAAYLDNLWRILQVEPDPGLIERFGECADYLFRAHFDPAEAHSWTVSLIDYFRASGDRRAVDFLKDLPAEPGDQPGLTQRFEMLGLLRELAEAKRDPALRERASALIREFEQTADDFLADTSADDHGITWAKLSVYVLGAAQPVAGPAERLPVSSASSSQK